MIINFLKSSYQNVKNALIKTGSLLGNKIRNLFTNDINEETLDQLEQLLYEADLGVQYAQELTKTIKALLRKNSNITSEEVIAALRQEILTSLHKQSDRSLKLEHTPTVVLIVGVNGNGKTTSIAKLAHLLQTNGKKVLLGACDTFRAAAIEQLETWAGRLNIEIIKGLPNSDPASVAFDALTAAKARGKDIAIIDTAGRLHTKIPLMQELEKIKRTCKKIIPEAPHETLLVLDATTGQNGVEQAKVFNQFTPITGLILTKLDGTAKGGTVLAIEKTLNIPVKFIGVGEGLEDLRPFDPETFVNALFE
jgi:fused signal recognition particle receptor